MNGCPPNCTCCHTDITTPFAITINPEARVDASRTASPIPRVVVGQWTELPFTVVNQGFVTGDLEIEVESAVGAEVNAPALSLTGAPMQHASFTVRLDASQIVDVTLRFWALGAMGGLANKNTLNFLLRPTSE